MTPDELELAACKGKPSDDWFPVASGNSAGAIMSVEEWRSVAYKALRICATCPVRSACRDEAIRTRDDAGVRGGLTPPELRQRVRGQARKRQRREMPHGTRNRYIYHGCRCAGCTKANTDYQRARRAS